MGRKPRHTLEQKVKACDDYINGNKSLKQIRTDLNINKSTILDWIAKYQSNGTNGLINLQYNQSYSKELKLQVVREYKLNLYSLNELVLKYNIRSHSTVLRWIHKYNRNEQLENYYPTPEVYCMKSRKTTKEEKIEISKWCIENNNDYKKAAIKFNLKYAQVYSWVKKYKEKGEDAFDDNRGQRKADEELSIEEKLKRENEALKKRALELERENELLKKLNAFEWKD